MATVVRLKRRRDEDPLETLLLATKKQRTDNTIEQQSTNASDKSIFKFAGTVSSKDDGISRHVREAIRKEKLEREFKQHQVDILGTVRHESRQQKHTKSQQNRFKVTSKYRALALDRLDSTDSDNAETEQTTCQLCGLLKHKQCDSITDNALNGNGEVVQNISTSDMEKVHQDNGSRTRVTENNSNIDERKIINKICECGNINSAEGSVGSKQKGNIEEASTDRARSSDGISSDIRVCDVETGGVMVNKGDGHIHADNRFFCLVDMEAEHLESSQMVGSTTEQITCNSEPMVSELVSERSIDDDYVYDIYYTNSRQFDFRVFERDLIFEAHSSEVMLDRRMSDSDDEFVYGDDDDENTESNWRNDYPDEDPRYYENDTSNYTHGDDMDEHLAFETETGNQLADWMSWRCNIDGGELSSDEDDADHYGNGETTRETFYTRVRKELCDDDDGEGSDDS